jgi:cell division protein FtsL
MVMTEYHTVKRIDNSRLVRPASPARLRDFRRRAIAGAAIAACLLFYAWQHFECIQFRYQLEELESSRAKAAVLNQQLHLEVDTLGSPSRVYAIAGKELGLTVAAPGLAAPAEASSDAVLAQARAVTQPTRP